MADRLLIGLVAAMALLAALALAGRSGADQLAERWREGAQAAVTVQVPQPTPERMDRALAALRDLPEVAQAQVVDPARMAELLRPWLGGVEGLPLPGVIELRLANLSADAALIGDRVAAEVPGAVTEAHGVWVAHLAALARAVQGLALAVLALVAAVAAAVVGVAVRAGLSARRDAVLVLHGLGATDADVAGRVRPPRGASRRGGCRGRHGAGGAGARRAHHAGRAAGRGSIMAGAALARPGAAAGGRRDRGLGGDAGDGSALAATAAVTQGGRS